MFGIGFQEMIIILVVILLVFGPKRLPDLAKSMGKGLAEFKKASEEVRKGIEEAVREEEKAPEPPKGADGPPPYPNEPGHGENPPAADTAYQGTIPFDEPVREKAVKEDAAPTEAASGPAEPTTSPRQG